MACTSGESSTAEQRSGAATISALHPDVIESHILTRLDGASLGSAAATCSQLHALSSSDHLWSRACRSMWPSSNSPRVSQVISTFPNASRSFFSDSFTASRPPVTAITNSSNGFTKIQEAVTTEIISAVDLFYGEDLMLSKVIETETETGWFLCSPFRVDLLDPKEAVRTEVSYRDDTCHNMVERLRLSWIVIDPAAKRAVNVASRRAVSVRRHWLTGEVEARFPMVVSGGERGTAAEAAVCGAVVTWGVSDGGEMNVREVSLQIEDMDGTHLNGRDSLVILKRALEGKRVKANVEEEEKSYKEFMKEKEERKERKARVEGRLDMLCVGLATLAFAGLFGLFVFWRWH
ncbi:probable F-box protein At2g36090 [Arachis hypogaea]|uniref:probable F-box protein At2g36090 n=1 Tax=Arachis hypogaea TaxID=3818 RepID=UPI000DECA690|nr:probable F-box protein At2g36090 [Arachis hypogaea]XP_025635879.1 probable F-box protein At2g36090 [Arachis hypogaea]